MTQPDDRLTRFEAAYAAEDPPPWDSGIVPPEVRALVEGDSPLLPGRALDVGCGTGTSSIFLAQAGWQVVGVDWVARAVEQALQRARQADVLPAQIRFLQADITSADFLPGEAAFDLWLDIGCLHGLEAGARQTYAAHVDRLVGPDGMLRLYVWRQHEREGQVVGLDPAEVMALFSPAFRVVDVILGQDASGKVRPSAWYTFRRTGETA